MFNLPGCTVVLKIKTQIGCSCLFRNSSGSPTKKQQIFRFAEPAAPPRLEHQRSPWWIDGWLRYHPGFWIPRRTPSWWVFSRSKHKLNLGFFHPSILSCPPGTKTTTKSSSTKKMGGGRTKKIDSGLYISEKWTWFTRKSPLRNFGEGTSYLVHHCVVFILNLLIAQWSHRHINNRIFAVICLKTHGWKAPVLSPSIRAKVYWVYFLLYHIFPTLIYADVPMHRSEGNNIHITITILG